ncbi:DNA-binding transcriptional regulator, LysR family [Kosakonia oryzendophytica]|uniref:DNA-binding transcriptional regulator, LysR family n=1 Tax=Kosakonia oryzendophytica TaxID=1005665 RepID=A0A1C4AHZ2_9ENTR|nr:LysR family transcriptional regulator [Kosakonia oryzendophytica]SCB94121.1 DNA-binding transcriptional regulator, LysR family [Kosakonia oryzendophytica]
MDIKLLRSFAVVAQLEHIGQAAERLNISSSPLSRQIQLLEDELGVVLFHREKKRLHLTTEGEKFLDEVGPFLQHYDRLKEHGKHLGRANTGRIDIGYVEAAIHSHLLPDTLAALDLSPDIDIRLHAMRSKQQLEQLQDRVIDIAFLHTPPAADAPFCQKKIFSEPVMLAMPKAKALRDPTPDGLHNHPWIAEQESLNPAARRRLLEACQKKGFTPRISLEVCGPLAALSCVEAGLGFTFIQQSLASIASDNVTVVTLPWLPLDVTLHMVWRKEETKPLVQRFLAAFR